MLTYLLSLLYTRQNSQDACRLSSTAYSTYWSLASGCWRCKI